MTIKFEQLKFEKSESIFLDLGNPNINCPDLNGHSTSLSALQIYNLVENICASKKIQQKFYYIYR